MPTTASTSARPPNTAITAAMNRKPVVRSFNASRMVITSKTGCVGSTARIASRACAATAAGSPAVRSMNVSVPVGACGYGT